jgi:putative toxin-antitoxin system antitoxin component (TIGR02293 family)
MAHNQSKPARGGARKKPSPKTEGKLAPHVLDWLNRGATRHGGSQAWVWMLDIDAHSEHYRPKHLYYFTLGGAAPTEGLNVSETSVFEVNVTSGCTYCFEGMKPAGAADASELLTTDLSKVVSELTDVAVEVANTEEAKTLLRLARASSQPSNPAKPPAAEFEEGIFNGATAILGGVAGLGTELRHETDLLAAVSRGFPVGTLGALKEAGYSTEAIEKVVAPRRTLARRRAAGKRLTQSESDAVWRLAHCLALATGVLRDRESALDWLCRSKPALENRRPLDLLATGVGSRAVERLLLQLEWGNVA